MLDAIATALTVVLKRFGDAAMPYVDGLMPSVGSLLVRACASMHGAVHCTHLRSHFLPACLPAIHCASTCNLMSCVLVRGLSWSYPPR